MSLVRGIAAAIAVATIFVAASEALAGPRGGYAAGSQQPSANTPIERDAVLSPPDIVPRAQLLSAMDASVAMIRASGWRCDSISGFRALTWDTGWNVHCNQFRYHYEIKDRGGRWVAELK